MLIDLREINTLWYGGLKPGREERLTELLQRLNFKFNKVVPVSDVTGVKGCTLSNQKTLIKALEYNSPVLVLEDDCRITDWYNPILEVPDDADAVYIGTSIRGLIDRWEEQDYKKDPIWHGSPKILSSHEQVYKVSNMLTTHAILYITKRYIKHNINLIFDRKYDDIPVDILYASNMGEFNVYAVKRPIFYQDCECEYTKKDTLTPIETLYE